MRYCGITEGLHNAAITFIDGDGNIEFASESERYTKIKNDSKIHPYLQQMIERTDKICWYEDPRMRASYIGLQKYNHHTMKRKYKDVLTPIQWGEHHKSHAASSYYTRPWNSKEDTVILNIDGYGEYQSATIYNHKFELLHEVLMPYSIGSMYAIITKLLGFRPMQEEYIVMGMASFGDPLYVDMITQIQEKVYKDIHDKLQDWKWQTYDAKEQDRIVQQYRMAKQDVIVNDIKNGLLKLGKREDIAASIQKWAEIEILKLAKIARKYGSKLCYAGGVAQNVKANTLLHDLFDEVWIAVNPTDGGCSLGAAARQYCLSTGKDKINFVDAYLGFDDGGTINPSDVVKHLNEEAMCGVISGPAEFGPRALGNRSLLADPRLDIKDTVNTIKRRQKFRPFAPVILEEYVDEYFDGPTNPYMQFTAKAKHDYNSVTHVDGSARVQTVPKNSRSIIRPILEEWYEKTGVPMLLNTSLNVKGKPICNDRYDGYQFQVDSNTKVFYNDSY